MKTESEVLRLRHAIDYNRQRASVQCDAQSAVAFTGMLRICDWILGLDNEYTQHVSAMMAECEANPDVVDATQQLFNAVTNKIKGTG